ncbi:MAG: hypothetical protein JXQ84_06500 [Rhodospirillaceae bacterium]|nr:hypothetical protein [Rhodospirillaceae bacterium]
MTATSREVEGVLTRRGGAVCEPMCFAGRYLGEADLGELISLHAMLHAGMPPELLCRETDAFFADHLVRRGRILGLFAVGRLIAYGVLGLPDVGEASFADDLGLTAETVRVACVDGAGVAPEWRGNHLHRLLIDWRVRTAYDQGRLIVLSTVAPGNRPSLRNLLASGLTIRGLCRKFGGMRFLMRRDLDRPLSAVPLCGGWIAADDLDGQSVALSRGDVGWALVDEGAFPHIWYAPLPALETLDSRGCSCDNTIPGS